jgi:putative transcription factor
MSSFCELCGRELVDEKRTVVIEGAVITVCRDCSKRGKPYTTPISTSRSKIAGSSGPTISTSRSKIAGSSGPTPRISKPSQKIQMTDETILNPEFAKLIRERRLKMGLTHEQLGALMNEKAMLLRKFETGALKPDELFARKLQRFLGINLYRSIQED